MEKWYILGMMAIICFGVGSFFGKIGSAGDLPSRVYFFEALGTLTVFSVFFIFNREEIMTDFRFNPFALAMGITWGAGTVMFIIALQYSKLSIIAPLTALYPAVTVLLAYLFLGERLEIRELTGISLAILSLFLLSK